MRTARAAFGGVFSVICSACSPSPGGDAEAQTTSDASGSDGGTEETTGGGCAEIEARWSLTEDGGLGGLDRAQGVAITPGGLVVVGYQTAGGGTLDAWAGSFDSSGAKAWDQSFEGDANGDDQAFDVAATEAGVVVAGTLEETEGGANAWLAEIGVGGETLWSITRDGPAGGDDFASAVASSADGKVAVGGCLTEVESAGGTNAWVALYDGPTEVWSSTIDGGAGVNGDTVTAVLWRDQDVIVGGFLETPSAGAQAWLAEYSAEGELRWSVEHGLAGDGADQIWGICSNGPDLIVAGMVTETAERSLWLASYDADGVQLWSVHEDGPTPGGWDTGKTVACTSQSIVVGGFVENESLDAAMLAFDGEGVKLWSTTTDGSAHGPDTIEAIDTAADLLVAVGGRDEQASGWDAWVGAFDSCP